MEIMKFMDIIKKGFDVSFNYKDVFYTISLLDDDKGLNTFGIGADNGFQADFDSIDSIPKYIIDDKKIEEIISSLSDDEIFY